MCYQVEIVSRLLHIEAQDTLQNFSIWRKSECTAIYVYLFKFVGEMSPKHVLNAGLVDLVTYTNIKAVYF